MENCTVENQAHVAQQCLGSPEIVAEEGEKGGGVCGGQA